MRKLFLLCIGLLFISVYAIAQNRTISGKVSDEKGNGLANASVLVRGTNIGTATGSDGSFTLSVPATASVLVVSYVGIGERQVSLTNAENYNIKLTPGDNSMNEVVVAVAYGEQEKKKLTG